MGTTVRTAEIDRALIEGISQGIPLAELCRKHEIGRTTVYDWQDADPAFAERIARARKVGFDAIAEETLEIADDGSNDWMERRNDDGTLGEPVLDHEHVQRSKLRIETRLKLLAKWDPKRYGDKIDVTSDGEKIGTLADTIAAARARAADGNES